MLIVRGANNPVPSLFQRPRCMILLSGLEQSALARKWSRGTVIVLLTGFFDESGEHEKDGSGLCRLTLGGFYAEGGAVRDLCEKWRRALDAEGLAEFHMKEIASDEYDFANWSPERQNRLNQFVEILASAASEFGAFSYPVSPSRRAFKDAYETALARVLITASSLADRTGEHVQLVFAYTDEIRQGRIGEYFDQLHWGEYLDGFRVARSRNEPALQAAEIVARGLKRLMEDGSVMPSFLRLAQTGKPFRFWPENPVAASQMIQASRRAEG